MLRRNQRDFGSSCRRFRQRPHGRPASLSEGPKRGGPSYPDLVIGQRSRLATRRTRRQTNIERGIVIDDTRLAQQSEPKPSRGPTTMTCGQGRAPTRWERSIDPSSDVRLRHLTNVSDPSSPLQMKAQLRKEANEGQARLGGIRFVLPCNCCKGF